MVDAGRVAVTTGSGTLVGAVVAVAGGSEVAAGRPAAVGAAGPLEPLPVGAGPQAANIIISASVSQRRLFFPIACLLTGDQKA